MKIGYASCGASVAIGLLLGFTLACASGTSQTAAPAAEPTALTAEKSQDSGGTQVVIQVDADCKVDKEEATISESKGDEAVWELNGDPGPLAIEFKETKGKNALDVSANSATSVRARIKLAKQQGRHPYRIKIGEKECPDPVLIIDG